MAQEIKVPDIGDFDAVEVIEVLVAAGDEVEVDQPLITLESDKATMEVPSTAAGRIAEMKVSEGDKVGQGDVIALIEADEKDDSDGPKDDDGDDDSDDSSPSPEKGPKDSSQKSAAAPSAASAQSKSATASSDAEYDVLVLGSGPGGYTAAFRAADLGLKVVLVERYPSLGGVCLNVGCIPSKALLHAAKVIDDAAAMADHGVQFGAPQIDLDKLLGWKTSVVEKLTGGLKGLAKQRKVTVVHGEGRFTCSHALTVRADEGEQTLSFKNAIIAAGSEAVMLPDLPDDPRIVTSTGALSPDELPETLLVIGGGIIGLEMANVYASLGCAVDVVEMTDGLIPGADRDLVKPLQKRMTQRCRSIWVGTKVTGVEAGDDALTVRFEGDKAPESEHYQRVLVAVGRRPNGKAIGADALGIEVSERGFVPVDKQCRTQIEHIFAIGDITGEPQLAHRATHMGKVAAECCAGEKSAFDARCIPSVVYTDPEVAWVGLTETRAKSDGVKYEKGSFPWAASGRALGMDASDGFTKLLFDEDTGRLIGAGAVGAGAGELVAEMGLAIEMGAEAADIGLTVHAHPTLSETVAFAAEAAEGTLTDLYIPRKKLG